MEEKGDDVCGIYENIPRSTQHDNIIFETAPYSGPERSYMHLQYATNRNSSSRQRNNVIPNPGPRFPKFAPQEQRLKTYKELSWPIGLQQRPEQLAEAGFYYLGKLRIFILHNYQMK